MSSNLASAGDNAGREGTSAEGASWRSLEAECSSVLVIETGEFFIDLRSQLLLEVLCDLCEKYNTVNLLWCFSAQDCSYNVPIEIHPPVANCRHARAPPLCD